MKIKTKIARLKKKILECESKIKETQGICPHTNATKVANSNTGNYDPSADCYWYDFDCPDCLKKWSVDQKHWRHW